MEMMQQGKANDVYWELTGSSLPAGGSLLPLDIAFILYPKEMSTACMEAVKQAFEKYSNSAILCGLYVSTAEEYAERYGIEIEGLEEAREEVKKKELKEKQKNRQRTDHASSSGTSSSKKSSGTSKRRRNNSYSPSYSLPDPEDHDIEAYYEDNRDEYDDYDDAYEGFLDDDSAWDDY